jgi:hypothetical protein
MPKHGVPCGLGLAESGSGSEAGAANGQLLEGVQPERAADAGEASGVQAEGMQLEGGADAGAASRLQAKWVPAAAVGGAARTVRGAVSGGGAYARASSAPYTRGAPQRAQQRLGSADRPTRQPNDHDVAQVHSVAVDNLRHTVNVCLPVIFEFTFSLSEACNME